MKKRDCRDCQHLELNEFYAFCDKKKEIVKILKKELECRDFEPKEQSRLTGYFPA